MTKPEPIIPTMCKQKECEKCPICCEKCFMCEKTGKTPKKHFGDIEHMQVSLFLEE